MGCVKKHRENVEKVSMPTPIIYLSLLIFIKLLVDP